MDTPQAECNPGFSAMAKSPFSKDSDSQGINPGLEWQDILRFLNHGQFDQAEAAIKRLQGEKNWAEWSDLQFILTAVSQICLACDHLKSQEEWHRNSYQDALKRELELQQALGETARQLMECGLSQLGKFLHDPQSEMKRNGLPHSIHSGGAILKQVLQKILPHKPSLFSGKGSEVSTTSFPSQDDELALISLVEEMKSQPAPQHSLFLFCLGKFQVYLDSQIVVNWPSSKGKSIFKYLVTHKEQPVSKEVLMELFWRDVSPESARRNLNWAIHSLRQVLHKIQPDYSHVLFQNDCYLLNPELQIWMDIDKFNWHIRTAQMLEEGLETELALREYQAAEVYYQGEFLEEDRFEDWMFPIRQSMQDDYLRLLDRLSLDYYSQKKFDECVNMCNKMLTTDPCREEAHRRLMQCYYQQGYPYLAIRQYHLCVERLKSELDVAPSQNTTNLCEDIRQGKGKLLVVRWGNFQD